MGPSGRRDCSQQPTPVACMVYLGHGTIIGENAIVIDNVAMEAGVIVGGGGVVTRAAAAGERLVGVPARHAPALRRFGPTPRND